MVEDEEMVVHVKKMKREMVAAMVVESCGGRWRQGGEEDGVWPENLGLPGEDGAWPENPGLAGEDGVWGPLAKDLEGYIF